MIACNLEEDDRILCEKGVEAQIAKCIKSTLYNKSFRLVYVRFFEQKNAILQIILERCDEKAVTLEDCVEISREVSLILDTQSFLKDPYSLEISSPGMDRPLVRKEDFIKWQGHKVKIETEIAFLGKKRFSAIMLDLKEEGVVVAIEKKNSLEKETCLLTFESIVRINLIPEENFIRSILKQEQKKRKENKKRKDSSI